MQYNIEKKANEDEDEDDEDDDDFGGSKKEPVDDDPVAREWHLQKSSHNVRICQNVE